MYTDRIWTNPLYYWYIHFWVLMIIYWHDILSLIHSHVYSTTLPTLPSLSIGILFIKTMSLIWPMVLWLIENPMHSFYIPLRPIKPCIVMSSWKVMFSVRSIVLQGRIGWKVVFCITKTPVNYFITLEWWRIDIQSTKLRSNYFWKVF